MALLVWLPLRGDLRNLGLSNITVTNNGATVSDEGKIGKCYYFNGTSQYLQFSDSLTTLYEGDFSWALWVKPIDDTRGILISEWSSTGSSNVALELLANRQIRVYWNASPDWSTGKTVPINTWSHIAVTKKSDTIKVYINGSLVAERVYNYAPRSSSSKIRIGDDYRGNTGSTVSYMGYINDVRIYDHCLSPKEVKEISKGLVLHYKLDTNEFPLGNINLVKNGWGGTDNWIYNSSTTVSTDVPNVSGIINSYSNSNTTKEFIPIHSDHSYTISAYVKKYSQNYCYISVIPYDADYLRISNLYTPDGFKASSLTTLSQDLKSGDTVIHLTNLSNWANPTTYQYFIAIFGYKDSTGYVYPDLFYTRRVYSFGSTTDKSKLDIENNTVTLNSPYSGETIPSGTSACLATSGSTYYYPAYIAATSAEDWTFLTKTFIPKNINYLKPAKYAKIISMGNYLWLAGITLIDNTESSNIIHDYSGYLNDGTIMGNSSSNVSPRYSSAISMNNTGTTNHIETDTLSFSDNIMSVSFWVKSAKAVNHVLFAYPNKLVVGQLSNLMCVLPTGSGMFNLSNFKNNDWNHIVAIRNVDSYQLFINGTEEIRTTTNNYYVHNGDKVWLLNRNYNTSYAANAAISDVRLYTTVLSGEDIKELYNTSAIVDNLGNDYCYLFEELMENIELNPPLDSFNHTSGVSQFDGKDLVFTGKGSSYSNFIEVDTSKTLTYDITFSNQEGSWFLIGFERYDENKATVSNSGCIYVTSETVAADHKRISGVITLSDVNDNPCKFTKIRVLNCWNPSSTITDGVGKIHSFHFTQSTGNGNLEITKLGLMKGGWFIEDEVLQSLISKNKYITANQFIEI